MKIESRVSADRLDKAGGDKEKGTQSRLTPAFLLIQLSAYGGGRLLFT